MFRIDHPDLDIGDNLRRAARAEFDQAIEEIAETGFEVHDTIRNVRRRLKRVRAILRLTRPVFADYRAENKALRDIGREVSVLRDVTACVEATDLLAAGIVGEGEGDALARVRQTLVDRSSALETRFDREALLSGLRVALRAARVRSELWQLRKTDERAIVPGLAETYRRARNGLRRIRRGGEEDEFHAWRKHAKCHAAHISLLVGVMPAFAEPRRRAMKKLAAQLGDVQNLALLEDWLDGAGRKATDAADADPVLALIANELTNRMGNAMKLGGRLFAEPTRIVERRWHTYVDDWLSARRFV